MRTALTIAGSDSSGGAGIQADLKTFAAFGLYGVSAITAVTAQSTKGIEAALALEADFVTAQIEAVAGDFTIDATKIGMLANAAMPSWICRSSSSIRSWCRRAASVCWTRTGCARSAPSCCHAPGS